MLSLIAGDQASGWVGRGAGTQVRFWRLPDAKPVASFDLGIELDAPDASRAAWVSGVGLVVAGWSNGVAAIAPERGVLWVRKDLRRVDGVVGLVESGGACLGVWQGSGTRVVRARTGRNVEPQKRRGLVLLRDADSGLTVWRASRSTRVSFHNGSSEIRLPFEALVATSGNGLALVAGFGRATLVSADGRLLAEYAYRGFVRPVFSSALGSFVGCLRVNSPGVLVRFGDDGTLVKIDAAPRYAGSDEAVDGGRYWLNAAGEVWSGAPMLQVATLSDWPVGRVA